MSAAQSRAVQAHDHPALLALNNAHATALSLLDADGLAALLQMAWHARLVPPADGLLIALDQSAAYANANFAWLAERFTRFVYVDRIVIAARAQRRGLAAQLYDDLIRSARAAAQPRVVCEVNLRPPNPASLAFHRQLGFVPVGDAVLANGKQVQYLEKML
ncbi:GNAT family N-acetyltransferase [Xanthomonas vesicatoria]|uniref:Putative acetyltransferase, GNAT superfamily n=2 Tax=Xanthomonas vesicatoria TaxID=56460 RepID=F0BD86_9XANT|nr:GNAT family N-acetyltransferase [Xanthomonas vesicatoria]APP76115.1 GNAT family N-acetyltransferase [Xanthomonas vesicatoria ATCC 35937]EGD06718.1 putative acetyltransferase, GNAT superfamily [Xanthomonas vesicatoria ATCC 35937]EGD08373.1 putative acetyltransferase, GNAT superfamily [Xanthomonas vesicatoria ATCC 35937]EGD09614.1 putative acetyltransferase, GNAT superfamily [Xanthomonas vesicatoria ATCC 35937]MCC8597713.1 GNAT family N-acetyltransferase [Xanthomonas vesicatoria]